MRLYNLGLFGVSYTRQEIHNLGENCKTIDIKVRHLVKFLSKKKFDQLKIFLSW